jgi:hypothetical protein
VSGGDAWSDWEDQGPSDLARALDQVHAYLVRFVAFPSEHAAIGSTLWAAHTHVVDVFDSTPRLAFLSPEPGSGKSRALEVLSPLVPHAMHAVNCTPAALFRSVADLDLRPTILFDEIDTVFGPKAKDNEEIRGFLNAGHRKSGVAYRCVGIGTTQKVVAFPAFTAVAVAGLNDVPDTIASRAVIIRMRRRAPNEKVDPFRPRLHEPEGVEISERLAMALQAAVLDADPLMPHQVVDRPADVWEPLISIAQAAGDRWPDLAEAACLHFAFDGPGREPSLSVRLLEDLFDVFDEAGHPDHMTTAQLVDHLVRLDEAPWSDLRGKPIDARRLSRMLGKYDVRPEQVWVGDTNLRGYKRTDLWDAWQRYLPVERLKSARSARTAEPEPAEHEESDPDLADLADLADLRRPTQSCELCGAPLLLVRPGRTRCASCEKAAG